MRTVPGLLLAAVAAATVIGAGPAAHADTNHDELWLGGGTRALRTSSANALTGDNLPGASLGYARELADVAPDLALWAEAGLVTGSAQGTMFQTLSTDLSALGVTGGLRARYQLHRLIAVSLGAALGAQRARVAISGGGMSASDHAWGTMASAGAALDLFALARPPFGIGVRAELGYVVAQAIELTPRSESGGDAIPLAMTTLPLGRLDLSGPTFAVSLVGQF
jgi:hypothetical protein